MTTTNIIGSNPGPASDLPDFPQSSIGNVQKVGLFQITLSPSAVAANTTAEQTFAATGIGLSTGGFPSVLPGDFVAVIKPTAQAGLGIVGARVSANDTLAITFSNNTAGSITPTASEVYLVLMARRQGNWSAPATGNQLDY
jgi:hypothetical protein